MTTRVLTTHELSVQRTSLEELVDRLIDAIFPQEETAPAPTAARTVHDARRLRQSGDLDGALAALSQVDVAKATTDEARWAYAEWLGLARRRYGGGDAALYSPGTGRAAVLAQRDDQTLKVLAVLGMRWKPGRTVSRRSLRGLKTLRGGASWS